MGAQFGTEETSEIAAEDVSPEAWLLKRFVYFIGNFSMELGC